MADAVRILVTGSRDWDDIDTVWAALADLYQAASIYEPLILVHGACRTGADAIAADWGRWAEMTLEPHPAQWRPYGTYNPQAGLARNRKMVDLGADICLAFIKNGSRGATHCADYAEEKGITVKRFLA